MGVTFFLLMFIFLAMFYTYAKWLGIYAILVDDPKINDVPRDYNYTPKVSIMLSAFNEGPHVYECVKSIMESTYPLDKIEVIAYDDCSPDDTWEYLQKIQSEYPNSIIAKRNATNQGKCFTLVEIARQTTGEILISIDSDTIFDSKAIRELVSCYADPDMGAVGGQIKIKNVNDSLWSQLQTVQYAFTYYFYKAIENRYKVSRCLCGPLVSFRREVYMPLLKQIENRNFLGEFITYGEDTFLTILICFGIGLDKKWKVYNAYDALGWTGTPTTIPTYLNQQIRWRRGTMVNGLFTISKLWQNCMDGGIAATIINVVPSAITVSAVLLVAYLFCTGQFLVYICTLMCLTSMVGIIKCVGYNLWIGRKDRMGPLKNPVLTGIVFGSWVLVSWVLLNFFATFTLDDGGWVTRQSAGNLK